jgi:hypothetical protein
MPVRLRRSARCRASYVVSTALVVCIAGVASAGFVPGGGNPAADCYMGFDVTGVTSENRRIECVEGDPCDTGACGDGRCTFEFSVCVNQPGVAGCTPPAGGLARVKTPGPFRDAIPASLVGPACGSPVTLELKLKGKGTKSNKRVVRPRAMAQRGTRPRSDRDAFRFVCEPRTEPCASPSGAFVR